MGFYYVNQAGLKLLTSDDLPASAFQSAGITAWATTPSLFLFFDILTKKLYTYHDSNLNFWVSPVSKLRSKH